MTKPSLTHILAALMLVAEPAFSQVFDNPGAAASPPTTATGAASDPLADPDSQDVAVVTDQWTGSMPETLAKQPCDLSTAMKPIEALIPLALAQDPRINETSGRRQFHALVHVLLYGEGDKPSKTNCWYVARRISKDKLTIVRAESDGQGEKARIFGSENIAVVFALLNRAPGLNEDSITNFYRATVKKKLPQNIANLLAALRLAVIAKAQSKAAIRSHWYGGGFLRDVSLPSDITVVPAHSLDNKEAAIGKVLKVDNEGKYWWDVSVGIPATKLTALEYIESDSQFTAKEVNKQTAYAMFNLFLGPVDLKGNDWRPRLLFGTGITGHPGDRLFLGGGIGLGIVQVFAGTAISNNQVNDANDPKVIRHKYGTRLAMGVNIPVFRALEKLSKKK